MIPLAYWEHNLSPFLGPHWGAFGIRYYGLAYLLGFVAAAWLLVRYARTDRSLLPTEKVADLMVAIIFGVMLGGRIGSFVLYHPEQLLHDPLSFFRLWEGGMASHGGMIGVAVALVWFSRSEKIPFRHLGDLIVSVAPAGLFFGRLANFINGELWGKPSQVPWAMIFPGSPYPHVPRHPSQLYEAALEGLVLLGLMQVLFWKTNLVRQHPGRLSGWFLISYAVLRAIGEVFREPDVGVNLILGLSRGTFYSIFLVAAGLLLIAWKSPALRPKA
ncbi:MAG TPA: prolipoprotein diacylglyceryl transferase [Opitutaceae bacterium]|nr:prolipoprotein diacylglyceryl transferase [Opitutaceae bacterium]HND60613.1 prolipoprotein diacylglyceryl transferase [Opitutaceae bacterium]